MRKHLSAALAVLMSVLSMPVAQANLVDDWSRNPEVRGARISPTGEYLAIVKDEDDQRVVAVFEFPAMKLINVIDFPGRSEVGNYWWVNDERLLVSVAVDWNNREEDVSYGELYAVNANGKKGKYLYGLRGDQADSTKSRVSSVRREFGSASLVDPRWDNPKEVLIEIREWNRGFKDVTFTAALDVYTGRITDRLLAPTANADVVADKNGEVRFSFYIDDDQNTVIHYRNQETGEWELFSKAEYGDSTIEPLEIDDNGNIYVFKAEDDGPRGLYLMDPETQTFKEIYQHDLVDIDFLRTDFQGVVYGAELMPDEPEQVFIKSQHPNAQLMMGLRQALPDSYPGIGSTTHDFRLSVVGMRSDTRSPEFFLYDREKNQLSPLFDAMPWIDDDLISPMEPIVVTARDGLELHGYLTVPKGAEKKNLPLIIVPHGGPHGPRDEWGYQWFEGFIPAAGYAVLQLNFRGSGGYGMAFERKGHREWGKKMQDDLTDATQWAIEQGIADPERICMFGWSYGGYATLMGIIREPDLYACAVAGAGVYDQDVQYTQSDFADFSRWGKKYIDRVIGPTREDRIAASPITYVDKIKTPLLLVHGEDDLRVPVEHAYELQKAMKAAGKPVPRLIELKNEAHTPRKEENNRLWRRETIKFFEKHIGPGIKPVKGQVASANR